MKKPSFILLATLLGACAKQNPMTSLEWSIKSRQALPNELSTAGFKISESVNTKFQRVEFADQKIGEALVDGSYLKKIYNSSGKLIYASAMFAEDPETLDTNLVHSMQIQRAHLGQDLKEKYSEFKNIKLLDPIVMITKGQKEVSHWWKVPYFDAQGLAWELHVDSDLRIISNHRVGSQFHETMALVFPEGPKLSQLQDVVLKNLLDDTALASNREQVSTQGNNKIKSVKEALNFNPGDEKFDQVQVFYFVDQALEWFANSLDINIPRKLDVQVHVGYPDKTNTAFYYNGNIRIGAGDDKSYSRIPQDPSIVMHETCHALIDTLARLPFEGEGGSLNEGFADFFTAIQLNNPNMGEVAYLKGPYKRTLENNFNVQSKNGGLYHDSGIVSGTLWDLNKNLNTNKAIEIALKTLAQLNPTSHFADFSQKLQQALQDSLSGKDLTAANNVIKNRGWK